MIKVGVVGAGYWGPNLIRNFMSSPKTSVKYVCDTDPEKLERALRPYPGVKRSTSLGEVLADAEVDAVAVATPVTTHYPIAKACLESGKHVLVEKPFTSSYLQAKELVELARSSGLQVMCDYTFCYTGAVRKIKEILDSGELGDILYYDSIRINLGLFQSDVNVIWDLAAHDLSIIDFLLSDRPLQVSAHGVAHARNNIESIAYVTLIYPKDFLAHFHVNWLSPVKIRKTIIGGSQKMLEWNDLVPAEKIKIYDKGIDLSAVGEEAQKKLQVSYRSGDIFSPRIESVEALSLMVGEFADSIVEKRPALTDGMMALRVLKILEAAERSIKADGANVRI